MNYQRIKILLLLALCLTGARVQAQNSSQHKSDSVFQLIKQYINEKNTVSIYALASEQYQAAMNEQSLNGFFEKQIFPLGPISSAALLSQNGDTSDYKLVFENVKLKLSYILNKYGKYDLIMFLPYEEPASMKAFPVASSNNLNSLLDKQVDSVARQYIQKSNTVGLCIGVIKDGKEYTYGYGETTKGNGNLPDANSIFEIGSITKTLTATLLAYYAGEHKIKLSDPITKYLPDSVAANTELQKIKIVQLSNHTSGLSPLPDNFMELSTDPHNPYIKYTKAMFFSDLRKCKLNTVPGDTYAYSNQAVALLGVILEKVSGKSYEEMVAQIITKPLKMSSTMQHIPAKDAKRFVSVYDASAEQVLPWDFEAMAAAGCLRSSVNDLMLYAKNNIKCSEPKLAAALKLAHETTYSKGPIVGLGWHIFNSKGSNYYWHNGETGGSRSFLMFNAEKNIAVVILSNATENADDVGINIMKKIM